MAPVHEIALQLTLKAMEHGYVAKYRIPHPDDLKAIPEAIAIQAEEIANFYNTIVSKIRNAEAS